MGFVRKDYAAMFQLFYIQRVEYVCKYSFLYVFNHFRQRNLFEKAIAFALQLPNDLLVLLWVY